jgi:hypothetical protein
MDNDLSMTMVRVQLALVEEMDDDALERAAEKLRALGDGENERVSDAEFFRKQADTLLEYRRRRHGVRTVTGSDQP